MAQRSAVTEPVPGSPVRRIVVPVSGSDREFIAQEHAVLFADALGVPIVAVHVSPRPDEAPGDLFDYIAHQARRRNVSFDALVLAGTDPVEPFLAELEPMDLAVIGSERIGDQHQIGGFAARVLHDAPGAVQVVRLGRFEPEAPEEAATFEEQDGQEETFTG